MPGILGGRSRNERVNRWCQNRWCESLVSIAGVSHSGRSYTGGGGFYITATNPSPGDPSCQATYFTFTATISGAGCDQVSGTFVNNLGTGDDDWTKTCDLPAGELTSSNGWADTSIYGSYPTLHKWQQTLTSSVNLGGRTVNETFTSGSDSCWIPGSPYGVCRR